MKKRLFSLLLALTMVLSLTACQDVGIIGGENGPTDITVGDSVQAGDAQTGGGDAVLPEAPEEPAIHEDGTYNTRDEVALYLWTYGHLPDNYITKSEARDLGWTGGSVEQAAPGCAIGGDRFGNREALLPQEYDYRECDIDTLGKDSRGAKRLVYTEDCAYIYYTEDHYESFSLLYGEE